MYTNFNKLLGQVRSVILRTKVNDQKTLKRWINPAPNHQKAMKKNVFGKTSRNFKKSINEIENKNIRDSLSELLDTIKKWERLI